MKLLKPIGAGLVVLAVAGGLWWWWHEGRIHPSTDDAYVQASVLDIAPQVMGRVATVAVVENAQVAQGDVLFTLDPAPFEARVAQARAGVAQAQQGAGASNANVAAAEARVASAEAALREAQATFQRQKQLADLGDVSQAALDQATSARDGAQAAVGEAEAALKAAQDQSGGDASPQVAAAEAALRVAQLDLDHATVTAPTDGWIANLTLRPGQIVSPGQPLFALVEAGDWWIEANFKETDLDRIRPGQPATIEVDMYPGLTLEGEVGSIGAGSGAVFSLLPPQNATGNWVKVTQRFPVRIALKDLPLNGPERLRAGASTTVTVDTSALK